MRIPSSSTLTIKSTMAVKTTKLSLIVVLMTWLLSAVPAHSQLSSITERFPEISALCEALNLQCNENLAIPNCESVCDVPIDIYSLRDKDTALDSCTTGGTVSDRGACEYCGTSERVRRLDFDGDCPQEYGQLFLNQATAEFISEGQSVSSAECLDDSVGNTLSQSFMAEVARIYCEETPSPSPTTSPSVTPTPTISPSASVTPTASSTPVADKPHGPRPGGNISACVRQLRRCRRSPNARGRGRFARGRVNGIERRCCRRFCRCRLGSSRRCMHECQISIYSI